MFALGIAVILGAVADILFYGFSVMHLVLMISGLLLALINSILGIKFIGKRVLRLFASLVISGLTVIFLLNIGPLVFLGAGSNVSAQIKKAEQIDIKAMYALSESMANKKNYDSAINQLDYVLKIDPGNSDAYELLGDCYFEKGDNIRGIYYYKLAACVANDSPEKHIKLAGAYLKIHSEAEAAAEFKKAKDLATKQDQVMAVYEGYSKMKHEMMQDKAVTKQRR